MASGMDGVRSPPPPRPVQVRDRDIPSPPTARVICSCLAVSEAVTSTETCGASHPPPGRGHFYPLSVRVLLPPVVTITPPWFTVVRYVYGGRGAGGSAC